jgi:hypothetical protein
MWLELLQTGLMIGLFAGMDWALKRFEKPYYAIHAFHNALIVYATLPDLIHTFTDLHNIASYPTNWLAIQLCFALHAYHVLRYYKTFRFDDWLHHGLMIGIALPIGAIADGHTLLGMSLFFTTGLPGGIDYALLFGQRNGWIGRITEKRINTVLNVWIRSPGCMAMASIGLASLLSHPNPTPYQLLGLIPCLLNYWNGQYFMQQVVTDSARLQI